MNKLNGEQFTKSEIKKRLNKMQVPFDNSNQSKEYYINLYNKAIESEENCLKIKSELGKDINHTNQKRKREDYETSQDIPLNSQKKSYSNQSNSKSLSQIGVINRQVPLLEIQMDNQGQQSQVPQSPSVQEISNNSMRQHTPINNQQVNPLNHEPIQSTPINNHPLPSPNKLIDDFQEQNNEEKVQDNPRDTILNVNNNESTENNNNNQNSNSSYYIKRNLAIGFGCLFLLGLLTDKETMTMDSEEIKPILITLRLVGMIIHPIVYFVSFLFSSFINCFSNDEMLSLIIIIIVFLVMVYSVNRFFTFIDKKLTK